MKIKNESLAVIDVQNFEEATRYMLRYTLNTIDYKGIWLWDFETYLTINVTSSKDGAIYFQKCETFEEAEKFVSHVFKNIDKIA